MGSVGNDSQIKPVFNVNRDRYDGIYVSDTQKERAENAIKSVQDAIQELLSDRFKSYKTMDDLIDYLWNGIHDAFSITAPDDEAIKITDTRDGDLIGVDIDLGTTRDNKLKVDLKPIIWSQDEFSDEELYEYFYIEKKR